MTAPAAALAIAPAGSDGSPGPALHTNRLTGLSSDYLNHFTEALMVLEMAGAAPECLDDIREWRPKSYVEHFAQSHFESRGAIIAAYWAADPTVRAVLDSTSAALNGLLAELCSIAVGMPEAARAPVAAALPTLRLLTAEIAAIINGGVQASAAGRDRQSAIDAMFDP